MLRSSLMCCFLIAIYGNIFAQSEATFKVGDANMKRGIDMLYYIKFDLTAQICFNQYWMKTVVHHASPLQPTSIPVTNSHFTSDAHFFLKGSVANTFQSWANN